MTLENFAEKKEREFQEEIVSILKQISPYVHNSNDLTTTGIPDIVMCFLGVCVGCEMKMVRWKTSNKWSNEKLIKRLENKLTAKQNLAIRHLRMAKGLPIILAMNRFNGVIYVSVQMISSEGGIIKTVERIDSKDFNNKKERNEKVVRKICTYCKLHLGGLCNAID